jgi:hypothetical protein
VAYGGGAPHTSSPQTPILQDCRCRYTNAMRDPHHGCGTTIGHGETCVEGNLCDLCHAAATGRIWNVRVPCGKTTGHGECCTEGRECDGCLRILQQRGYDKLMWGVRSGRSDR